MPLFVWPLNINDRIITKYNTRTFEYLLTFKVHRILIINTRISFKIYVTIIIIIIVQNIDVIYIIIVFVIVVVIIRNNENNKRRRRKIIWYNPPFNMNVAANVAKCSLH